MSIDSFFSYNENIVSLKDINYICRDDYDIMFSYFGDKYTKIQCENEREAVSVFNMIEKDIKSRLNMKHMMTLTQVYKKDYIVSLSNIHHVYCEKYEHCVIIEYTTGNDSNTSINCDDRKEMYTVFDKINKFMKNNFITLSY